MTKIAVPVEITNPRTLDSGSQVDAGYHVAGLLAIVQPPAISSCPAELITSSSHFVPAGTPLTRT